MEIKIFSLSENSNKEIKNKTIDMLRNNFQFIATIYS